MVGKIKLPKWTDEKDAAEILGLTLKSMKRQIREGKLPLSYTKASRKAPLRILTKDLEELLDRNTVHAIK